jgi:glycosyltransferase involved in cell wall biosynthesis
MSALVSVIIPTFNRASVLPEAVASALGQLHSDVEVIVVDDGSSDGTRELLMRAFGGDARVHYRYEKNAGVAAARNAGLEVSTGDYVAFLDSDDAWKPWHLHLALACLERLPEAGMIWTNMDTVDTNGAVIAPSYLTTLLAAYRYFSLDELFSRRIRLSDVGLDMPDVSRDHWLYVGDVFSPMVMGNLVLTSSTVMRRDCLDRVGRFDDHFTSGEDHEFFLRVSRQGPVAYADTADVRYRVGTSDRLSGSAAGPEIARAYLRVLDATLDRDADRITLSPAMIMEARSYAHRWVGTAELRVGSQRMARAHLASSLRIHPWQPMAVALLVLTFLPHRVVSSVARFRRRRRG